MRLRLLTLGLAATVFAAGCSDDDDGGTAPTTEAGVRVVHASPDAPNVDVVVVPVGGGGLISGVSAAVKHLSPRTRVYGVEPHGAPGLRRALDAGKVVRLDKLTTIAGGLAPPFAGDIALEHAQAFLSDVVLVSDAELLDGMRFIVDRARLVIEPSAAAGVAALLNGRIPLAEGETVAVVLSGGNVGLDKLAEWLRA